MNIAVTGEPDYKDQNTVKKHLLTLTEGTVTYDNIVVFDETPPALWAESMATELYLGRFRIPRDPELDNSEAAWINSVFQVGKVGEVWIFSSYTIQGEYCKRIAFHAHRQKVIVKIIP